MVEKAAYPGDLLDHLRAFALLCASVERSERAAFARTASALARDVSVLRRRMQTLATFVGSPLLESRGNRLRLTAAGARARVHAARTLEAAAELALIGQEDSGPLRIACTGTVLAELLPPAFRALRNAYPQLSVRVRRAGAESAGVLLEKGEIDFAIRPSRRPSGRRGLRAPRGRPSLVSLRPREPPRDDATTRNALNRCRAPRRIRRGLVDDEASHGGTRSGGQRSVDRGRRQRGGAGVRRRRPGRRVHLRAVASERPDRPGVALRDVTTHFEAIAFWLVWREGAALPPVHRRFLSELRAASHAPGSARTP